MDTPISVKVNELSQLPWNKNIPLKVSVFVNNNEFNYIEIVPKATSGHFKPDLKIIHIPQVGNYSFKFYYIPTEQGTINYTISVVGITNSTNFAASSSGTLTLNKQLVRTPITEGFLAYQFGLYIIGLIAVLGILLWFKKILIFLKTRVIPKLIHEQIAQGV